MVAKKRKTRKKRTKKVVRAKPVPKGPAFMVQLGDPMMLRKDLLESLRETIIFMQGYEKFRSIQDEKVALFSQLRSNLKELQSMIDGKLKKFLPQGNLSLVSEKKPKPVQQFEAQGMEVVPAAKNPVAPPVQKPSTGLDELEMQLKDIEGQLQNIK